MDKIDLRKLNNDELYLIRKQVIRLKKQGKSGAETEVLTGVTECAVSRIWQTYKKEGLPGIKPKVSGRKIGDQKLLTDKESKEIRSSIIDKAPEQYKLGGCLWTRQKISDFIKRKFNKTVSLRCVSNYMKEWGLTCQRPTKRAYSQDDVRVRSFMENEYPKIASLAFSVGAEIYWGDETGVNNTENYERGYAIKGHPPVLNVEAKKETVNMISAITNKGSVRFMVYDGSMNQNRFIDFMKRLVKDSTKKVFLIVDNLRVHHGKIVEAWLNKNNDYIRLFFLPPYSPELNPDEYLNHALKEDIHSGDHPRTKCYIKHKIHSYMRWLQHNKIRAKAFFGHKRLSYIHCNC